MKLPKLRSVLIASGILIGIPVVSLATLFTAESYGFYAEANLIRSNRNFSRAYYVPGFIILGSDGRLSAKIWRVRLPSGMRQLKYVFENNESLLVYYFDDDLPGAELKIFSIDGKEIGLQNDFENFQRILRNTNLLEVPHFSGRKDQSVKDFVQAVAHYKKINRWGY